MNEQNTKNESKFNEIKDEIKQLNVNINSKFNELEQSIERMGVWRIAVSYTHLDVYKRQGYGIVKGQLCMFY